MYVLLCSLHSICRFLFNCSIKVIVVLTTFSIISIPYFLNSVLQPYFMPIYSIILLYLFICNMSHVLEINYLILFYLIILTTENQARNTTSINQANTLDICKSKVQNYTTSIYERTYSSKNPAD